MAKRITRVVLDVVGEGADQFDLIQAWLDVNSVEGAGKDETAVAIFEAGMGAYLKAIQGECDDS